MFTSVNSTVSNSCVKVAWMTFKVKPQWGKLVTFLAGRLQKWRNLTKKGQKDNSGARWQKNFQLPCWRLKCSHLLKKPSGGTAAFPISGSFTSGYLFNKTFITKDGKGKWRKSFFGSGAHQADCYLLILVTSKVVNLPFRTDLQNYISTSAKIIPFHQGSTHISRGLSQPKSTKYDFMQAGLSFQQAAAFYVSFTRSCDVVYFTVRGKVHAQTTGTEVINLKKKKMNEQASAFP